MSVTYFFAGLAVVVFSMFGFTALTLLFTKRLINRQDRNVLNMIERNNGLYLHELDRGGQFYEHLPVVRSLRQRRMIEPRPFREEGYFRADNRAMVLTDAGREYLSRLNNGEA